MNHRDAYDVRTEIARALPQARVSIAWDGPRSYVVAIREAADRVVELWTPQQAKRFIEGRRALAC